MTPSLGGLPSERGGRLRDLTAAGLSRGASATELEGSTMIFIRSQTRRAVAIISSSLTSRMRSTCLRKIAKVRGEREARNPSARSEEHTSELQSRLHLVCRLLLEKKKNMYSITHYYARTTDGLWLLLRT